MLDILPQALLSGVLVGAVYALIALGLATTFGAMRIINLSHGEMVLLAAYMAATAEEKLGLDPYLAAPAAILASAAVAVTVFVLVDRLKADRELNSLILTFAIGITLTNAILLLWGSGARSTRSAFLQDAVAFGDAFATHAELIACGLALALMAGLWGWLKTSWHGRAVRAVASSRAAATLMGIDPGKVEVAAFLVSAVLAAFAGIALYTVGVISPALGHNLTVKAFVIVVLAGVGSIPGVLLGALLLAVTETLTITFASSALQDLAGMALFLLVLYALPSGLFGARMRRG